MEINSHSKRYNRLERWLLSPRGRRMLNRFYAWGAAFVILGALFKFLKWPYADVILFFSMMTEVCVFLISGFEPEEEESPSPISRSVKTEALQGDRSPEAHCLQAGNEAYQAEMKALAESISELQSEHKRMTQNLAELNRMYSRMLGAMTREEEHQD